MNKLNTVVLENGLTIYFYNDSRRHSTFFQLSTFCGGFDKHFMCDGREYHIQDGVHHILEHYIVECNERGNFLEELGHMQMSTNASTSLFVTNYYFETVENVLFGVRTLLEGVYSVIFDSDRLEKIKKPIYQEVRGKSNNKFYHISRHRMEDLFHNYSFRDVGGTLDEIEKTTIDDLKILYDAFYQPNNQFIVVAGSFDQDEVLKEIKEFYKTHPLEEHDTKKIREEEPLSVVKKRDSFEFLTPMNYTDITFKIDISNYSNTESLDFDFYMSSYLGNAFGPTSKLHKDLVDRKIINDFIGYGFMFIDHFMLVSISAYTEHGEEFEKAVFQEINHLTLNQEEFELDKKSAKVAIILRDENIFKMIFPFINNIVFFNYPYLDTISDVERLNYESYVDMIRNADFSNYSILTVEKEKK